jgi:undecaprenyl diphosphate synthase
MKTNNPENKGSKPTDDHESPHYGRASAPNHIAIIMDGNHRWAKKRLLPSAAGHRAGAKLLRPIAEACVSQGVSSLTVFAFSSENWHRPDGEVNILLDLMRHVMETDIDDLHSQGVRLRIIGERSRFAPDIQAMMERCENLTCNNSKLNMTVAVNFGGRWDIVMAAKSLVAKVERGELAAADISEQVFAGELSLDEISEPDLLIRTGGDYRISNFLLWHLAYTEMYFSDVFWPDFDAQHLATAITEFGRRKRRFGKRL